MSFDPPKSRNEAILQNMLGANNVLPPPKGRIEELLLQILQQGGSGGGGSVTVDSAFSETSENPVQNKVITAAIASVAATLNTLANKVERTPSVSMTASDTTPTIDPNKLYVFPEMASLAPTLATPTDNTVVNEYHFVFDSGSTATTLTLPASVLQPDGFTVEANHVYEISIVDNRMTAQGWAVTA